MYEIHDIYEIHNIYDSVCLLLVSGHFFTHNVTHIGDGDHDGLHQFGEAEKSQER